MNNIPRDVGKRPVPSLAAAYVAASAVALGGLYYAMKSDVKAVNTGKADTATHAPSDAGSPVAATKREGKNLDHSDQKGTTSAHKQY